MNGLGKKAFHPLMKIIAINREHSDKEAITLVTEPPLTTQVFQEFERRVRMPALQPEMVSGCLVIRPERYMPELRAELEQLLTARKQAEIEQSEKEITLESAAAGFELPIV
jgi:ferredoxin-NADP reductase